VTVPVLPQGGSLRLDLEVDHPGYQFRRTSLTLPVHERAGFYPLGVDAGEENALWRRKVMTQLP
jgi:hypothetical protein